MSGLPELNRPEGLSPRVRGSPGVGASGALVSGLSPRVRGSRRADDGDLVREGSIPACAGEPTRMTAGNQTRGVYPRVCGGAVRDDRDVRDRGGLSPRVRGSRPQDGRSAPRHGSIPACAGEPSCAPAARVVIRVYPRVCGGARGYHSWPHRKQGLSPRVRGSLRDVRGRQAVSGSIPACAGEPATPPGSHRVSRVYPRVCGGAGPEPDGKTGRKGLSPRVRGSLATCTSSANR